MPLTYLYLSADMDALLIRILLQTGVMVCLKRCQRESDCDLIGYKSRDLTCHLLSNRTGGYRNGVEYKQYDFLEVIVHV